MPAPLQQPRTLYDKIWDDHVMYDFLASQSFVRSNASGLSSDTQEDGLSLIYIDRSDPGPIRAIFESLTYLCV